MEMTIDCVQCGTPLLVPEEAAGRRARCICCGARFRIPSPGQMLDDTIGHYLVATMEQKYEQEEQEAEAEEAGADGGRDADGDLSATGTFAGVPAVDPSHDSTAHVRTTDVMGPASAAEPADADAAGDAGDADAARPGTDVWGEEPSAPAADAFDREAYAPVEPGPDIAPAAASAEADAAFSPSLSPTDARPYLVVRGCTVDGVRLAFDARWLNHEVFRTSMPLRCAVSGSDKVDELYVRPMIFTRRHRGDGTVHDLESRYQARVSQDRSPRTMVRTIGPLDGFAPPFNQPILYYVHERSRSSSVLADVVSVDGRAACEIVIPNGRTAMQWLERVNGRCGPEYALLRTEVQKLGTDAWQRMPDQLRQRISVWCNFQARERFVLYLNDADFTSRDAGLAGIVVTNERLIYHKYRRSRSVSLNQDGVLHISTQGKIARLTLESYGRMARCGKVHRNDVAQLVGALADAPRLRVEVRGGADNGSDADTVDLSIE